MSEDNLKTLPINDLIPGMFVSRVVKQSGKLRIRSQGVVKSHSFIEALRSRGIELVEIDFNRSILNDIKADASQNATATGDKDGNNPPNTDPGSSNEEAVPIDSETSTKTSSVRASSKKINTEAITQNMTQSEALQAAEKLYDAAKVMHKRFLKKIGFGEQGDLSPLQQVCAEIVESLFENSNAIICFTLIKDDGEYMLQHSLNSAILMGMFAKHLGYDKPLIGELSLAGLLMDSGMASVPERIHEKHQRLTEKEWNVVKRHVSLSVKMLSEHQDISESTLSAVINHHERLDGSGYPAGKSGDKISVFGRMAAIVDTYDALTSKRPYRKAYSPTNALKAMLANSEKKLDKELVQQFIKCVGVHPVGSLVRLRSDKLAIVVTANQNDALKPVVVIFYSLKTGSHTQLKRIDLSKVKDPIVGGVSPDDFKLNLNRFFREVFIANV